MHKKTVAFHTLGCKTNQYETNAMMQQFINAGYSIVSFEEKADIYIINTCTVTNMSDRKSRQALRRAKQNNSDAIVVATGCYVQASKDEVSKIEEIDLCLGINEKNEIVKHVESFIKNHKKEAITADVMHQKEFLDFGMVTALERTRAAIKIQDGCDRFCSYCIIPFARGRVRSRKIDSVINEVQALARNGIKEIVLTGIHIASYGKDLDENITLLDLIIELNKIEGLERIRLGSLEPTLLTKEFIENIKPLEKLCHHFHLSLQSGCDETLKRMNRRYTTKEFKEIVMDLRNAFEDAILTTDIIVGFPGESEEEFKTTYIFLKKINFYKMHVFPYSQRRGTKAAVMENQIDANKKEERSKLLIELSNKNEQAYLDTYIGKNVEVLFEQTEGDLIKGHTMNYLEVAVDMEQASENDLKDVTIIKRDNLKLIGNITER